MGSQPVLNDHLIETVSGEQSEKEGDFLFLDSLQSQSMSGYVIVETTSDGLTQPYTLSHTCTPSPMLAFSYF